jgi:hypothetical protein
MVAAWLVEKQVNELIFIETKLLISLKTNGRGEANPGAKLPFATK